MIKCQKILTNYLSGRKGRNKKGFKTNWLLKMILNIFFLFQFRSKWIYMKV